MFEDDIIVADGWMAKIRQAFREIEGKDDLRNWLYLRLFYTETSMQWQNTDFWYQHMSLTVGIGALTGFALLVLIRYQSLSARRHLDNWAIGVICVITIPAFIGLVFMIGKYSVFPPRGVFRMNKYGCCTQALVFPRHEVPGLVALLRGMGAGQTDTMIEEYADANGKERLALGPQLVQHVGLESSRDNTFVNSQSTWAFWFEENNLAKLREKHKMLTGT
jgi:hypothetical protein